MNNDKLSNEQRDYLRQKSEALAGKYSPIPHWIYRELLPELTAKYSGRDARDCLTLYMYMHAYTNGQSEGSAYLWAYPSVEQIRDHTGIHGDRIKKLCDILVSEGVMMTKRIPWYGHTKKMYMPLFERKTLS